MFETQTISKTRQQDELTITTILATELFTKLPTSAQDDLIDLLKSLLFAGRSSPVAPP